MDEIRLLSIAKRMNKNAKLMNYYTNGCNNKLINDSGLSLADGIYHVPYNTDADTIIWSGLYDCSGVIIDGTNRWGYMLVFAGSTYVKQIYFQNNSPLILVRQRHDGDEWSSWKELALKDDLPVCETVIIDPSGNDYVDISVPGIQASWVPIVFNGDYDAWKNGYVESVHVDSSNSILRAHLSEVRTGTIRLNYTYKKPST